MVILVLMLSALVMGAIVTVAKYLENNDLPELVGSRIVAADPETPPPPQAPGATTANAYALADWPTSPARRPLLRQLGDSAVKRARSVVVQGPIGVTVDQFRAAVAEGKRVFLPAPKGECQLSGKGASTSLHDLDSCFAAQAPR